MGYCKNKVLIVCGTESKLIKARKKAFKIYNKIFKDNFAQQNITPIMGGYCNGTYSFMISADGGRNMGDVSSNSEKARNLLKKWLSKNHCDFTSVVFGGDDDYNYFES